MQGRGDVGRERSGHVVTSVACHVLLAPDCDPGFASSAQDSFVVVIRTGEGAYGVGEADVNPWIAKACIEAPGTHTMGLCIKDLLVGEDPFDIAGLWQRICLITAMNGRRGAVTQSVVPHASRQPAGRSFEAYCDALVRSARDAKALGPDITFSLQRSFRQMT